MNVLSGSILLTALLLIGGFQSRAVDRALSPYTREAIQQAQQSLLIPRDAEIQKVDQGIEYRAVEGIPEHQKIDLAEILANVAPREVIANLQKQIDEIH